MDDFFDRTAAVGSDEEDEEDFDEETGEPIDRPRKSKSGAANGDMDDSSEEEDDDDEEEMRKIREGFIVDEDEDDAETVQRKREKKKRRREEREEEEELDEEDLDLIGAVHPDFDKRKGEQSKFKRLKRGHREDRSASEARGVEDIFSDDEEGADGTAPRARDAFGYRDDMDDFIEQDEFPDEEDGQLDEDIGVRAPKRPGFADLQNLKDAGLDEADLEDLRTAFGDDEFGWALEAEAEHNAEQLDPDKPLELKDVFEPSQLIEKMLTDDDNLIRQTDVPERFQLARKSTLR